MEKTTPPPALSHPPRDRAAKAVLAKIRDTYNLSDTELHFSAAHQHTVDTAIQRTLDGDKWRTTCQEALAAAGLGEEKMPQLRAISQHAMHTLSTALHIRESVLDKSSTAIPEIEKFKGKARAMHNFYDWEKTRRGLSTIYLNHLSNGLQKTFMDQGIDPVEARRLSGVCIRGAINAFGIVYEGRREISIEPTLGSTNIDGTKQRKSPEDLAAEQHRMSTYWRITANEMKQPFRDNLPSR